MPFGSFGTLLLAISLFGAPRPLFSFVPVFKILVSFLLQAPFPLGSLFSILMDKNLAQLPMALGSSIMSSWGEKKGVVSWSSRFSLFPLLTLDYLVF